MDIITEFQNWLIKNGKHYKTVEEYSRDIVGFITWSIKENNEKSKFNRKMVIDYRNYLLELNYAVTTVNRKLYALKSFNTFLVQKNIINKIFVYPGKDKAKINYLNGIATIAE